MSRPPVVVAILLALACVPLAHVVALVIWDVISRYLLVGASGDSYFDMLHADFAWSVMLACGAALVWRHDPAAIGAPGRQRWQRVTAAVVAALSALCFVALTMAATQKLLASIADHERWMLQTQPMWPLRLAPVVGFALAALAFIQSGVRLVRSARADGGAGTP